METLLNQSNTLNPTQGVSILRNKEGQNNEAIGYGNEKALNQLLAHHGIVFQPEDLKVWVSSNPYQLGEFVAYDLNTVFYNRDQNPSSQSLQIESLNIAKDSFLETKAYANYEAYRVLERKIEQAIANNKNLDITDLNAAIALNPNYWKAYALAGDYYYKNKAYKAAVIAYTSAQTKEIPTLLDVDHIAKYLKKATRKSNK